MKDYEMADLYKAGLSTSDIAALSGHSNSTVSVRLNRLGVAMRPGGRSKAAPPEPPRSANPMQGHRGPKLPDDLPPIEPRYSCGHKRAEGAMQCRICDRCSCPPKKRKRVRKYSGLWLCRCGRQIEP